MITIGHTSPFTDLAHLSLPFHNELGNNDFFRSVLEFIPVTRWDAQESQEKIQADTRQTSSGIKSPDTSPLPLGQSLRVYYFMYE